MPVRSKNRHAALPGHGERRRAPQPAWWHPVTRLAAASLIAMFVLSCGDDDPTSLGSDLRTAPDTLRVAELRTVVFDSVFHLPFDPTVIPDSTRPTRKSGIWLGASPTGQIGSQQLYATQLLFEFRVPTFILDVNSGDTLELDSARFEIGFTDAPQQSYDGTMSLALYEVAPAGRIWTTDSTWAEVPELQPGQPLSTVMVADTEFGDPEFEVEMDLDPKVLIGFDSVLVHRDSLDVNVACLFEGFDADGKGFIEFPYQSNARASNVRFVGGYRDPITSPVEHPSAPVHKLAVVEFDPNYTSGTNLVASDGHRLHTFVRFPDVRTVLPESAIVQAAELILVQADRGDSIFGEGPNIGVIVLSATDDPYDQSVNEKSLVFVESIVAVPELEVSINVTGNIFDQQEGTVPNHGYLLRLSNEGTKARHFEFFGSAEADSTRRPRIRITYGLPADFGGGGSP